MALVVRTTVWQDDHLVEFVPRDLSAKLDCFRIIFTGLSPEK